jgi:hypothetical protein
VSICRFVDLSLVGLSVRRFVSFVGPGLLVGLSVCRLLSVNLSGGLVGRLVRWSVGRLVAWSLGRLAGSSI